MGECPKCGCDDIILHDSIDFEIDFDSNSLWEKRDVICNGCGHEFIHMVTAKITDVKIKAEG